MQDTLGLCAYSLTYIKAGQLICEYTGELCNLDKYKDAEEVLSFGKITNQYFELGIVTDNYANEGRFFSGVSPAWKDKANCEIKLFSIEGVPRAFICSVFDIEPFELFYVYYGTYYDEVAV